MLNHIKIKKGHNIKMSGVPSSEIINIPSPKTVSIKPMLFKGVKPKLLVNVGSVVKIGSPLFFDKNKPNVKWGSPANGSVISIHFGARRVIENIVIEIAGQEFEEINQMSSEILNSAHREIVLNNILDANLFHLIRQRPFNKVANPKDNPRDIFITAYNSYPLGVNLPKLIESEKEVFQKGLTILSRLTEGEVFLTSDSTLDFKNVKNQKISGPHPAGNVGIQIHHTKPLKPSDIVWVVDAQHVITIGKSFTTGKYDPSIVVSVGGSGASKPQTVKSVAGANVQSLIVDQSFSEKVRIVSGNVLTGSIVNEDDFLNFYDTTLTLISDEVKRPFLGMLAIGSNKTKYSLKNTFFSFKQKLFDFNTSQNGELRAMVPLNAWEEVLPMDIHPNPLYRAILSKDIEEMEKLGIIECDGEDFALCSFACPSKIDVGGVINEGLDMMELEI